MTPSVALYLLGGLALGALLLLMPRLVSQAASMFRVSRLLHADVAHHFREQVAGDGLRFDYRIQPGPSSTRNAIALLKYMNYPDAVVADGLAAIDWQRQ